MVEIPPIIGHRGAPADQPENSLEGFAHCIASGVAGVELDVQLSLDGVPVVTHDWTLERMYGRPETIPELPASDLKSLGIPALDDVFSLCGRKLFYDVEIKHRVGDATPLVRAVLGAADRAGVTDAIMLSSFSPWAILAAKKVAPEVRRASIFGLLPDIPLAIRRPWYDPLLKTDALKPYWKDAHRYLRRSKPICAWTVDDPVDAAELKSEGVTSIITNDPVRMLGI